MFTYIAGSKDINASSTVISSGFNPFNTPGGRYASSHAHRGHDDDGQDIIYVFGGIGYGLADSDPLREYGYLNDLWAFNYTTKEFAMVTHALTNTMAANDNYTNPGISPMLYGPDWRPFPRGFSSMVFHKVTNSLFLYGGLGAPYITTANAPECYWDGLYVIANIQNCMRASSGWWQYGFEYSQWRLVHGNANNDYVAIGDTVGGTRIGTTLVDVGNHYVYSFGGLAWDGASFVPFMDIRRLDTSTGAVPTPMNLGKIHGDVLNLYPNINMPLIGIAETYVPTHFPGGRAFTTVSYNPVSSSALMYGGISQSLDIWNDVWEYSVPINMWRFRGGKFLIEDADPLQYQTNGGLYGDLGIYDAANLPFERFGHAAFFVSSELFVFGGLIGSNMGNNETWILNDLWQFSNDLREWRVIDGGYPPEPVSYGTKGVPSMDNSPGNRVFLEFGLVDHGTITFFGGLTMTFGNSTFEEYRNDVWEWGILYYCGGVPSDDDDVCSDHGECVSEDNCECVPLHWDGDLCDAYTYYDEWQACLSSLPGHLASYMEVYPQLNETATSNATCHQQLSLCRSGTQEQEIGQAIEDMDLPNGTLAKIELYIKARDHYLSCRKRESDNGMVKYVMWGMLGFLGTVMGGVVVATIMGCFCVNLGMWNKRAKSEHYQRLFGSE